MVSFILVGKVIILVKYGLRSNRTPPVDAYVPNYQKSKILIHSHTRVEMLTMYPNDLDIVIKVFCNHIP